MIHPIHKAPFTHAIYKVICDELERLEALPVDARPVEEKRRVVEVLTVWRDLFESGKDIEMEIGTNPWPIRL